MRKTWSDEDIMSIQLFKGDYWKNIELPNGIVIDITKDRKVMSLEISNAKKIFSGKTRKVLQSALTH